MNATVLYTDSNTVILFGVVEGTNMRGKDNRKHIVEWFDI